MIREIISNDSLTLILFGSFFLLIILKKIDSNIFYQNLSFFQRDSRNSFSNNLIGIKFPEIIYNILFISNLSLLLTFFYDQNFDIDVYIKYFKYLIIFFLFKILFDVIIGGLFSAKKMMRNYIYLKLVFNNSLGILILFFNFFIAYSIFDNHIITLIFITLSVLYFIYSYFLIFFSMKKAIYKNWFYFILYLCTLEIIPYYYLISKVLLK